MHYSLPYILFISFILIISIIQLGIPFEERARKSINYLVVYAYIVFLGFRGFIGWDWVNYYPTFMNIESFSIDIVLDRFDIGFVFYMALIKSLFKSFESFLVISTIINVYLLHLFFKRYLPTKYYALGFATFFAFNGFILETDLMRNIKSILIFILALQYIEERKVIPYFAMIFVALLFHWSAIIYIPLYFFLHKEFPLKFILIIFIIGNIIFLLQIEYITPIIKAIASLMPENISIKISGYLGSSLYSKSYGLTLGYIERTLMIFFVLYYYNRIKNKKSNILFLNSFIIYICLFLFCSEISIILQRVAGGFGYAYWILIPIIIHKVEKNIKPILFFFFLIIIITKMHLLSNNILYNYDSSLFNNTKSYKQRLEIYYKNYERLRD